MKNRRKQVGSCLHDTQQKRTTSTLQASYHDTRHGWGGGSHNSSRVWRWRGSRTSVLSTENSGVPFLSNIQGRFLLTLVHTISYSVKKRVMTSKEKKNPQRSHKKRKSSGCFCDENKKEYKVLQEWQRKTSESERLQAIQSVCVRGKIIISVPFFCKGIRKDLLAALQ